MREDLSIPKVLRASPTGMEALDSARDKKHLIKQSQRLAEEANTSNATLKRFWRRLPIQSETFISICEVIDVDWKTVVELEQQLPDWGESVEVLKIVGRTQELSILTEWIAKRGCRLVTILGTGGIGKSTCARSIATHVTEMFKGRVIWRSLREARPPLDVIVELIQYCSKSQDDSLPISVESAVNTLLSYLSELPCLIILDNVESILKHTEHSQYQQEFEGYGVLFKTLAESTHQSCIILTSREEIQDLQHLTSSGQTVHSLHLRGLDLRGKEILIDGDILASDQEYSQLIEMYSGNPLFLKLLPSSIQAVGNVSQFLKYSAPVLIDIKWHLDDQLKSISEAELTVLYWLAINREAMSIEELESDISCFSTSGQIRDWVISLRRRSLIEVNEQTETKYSLQNVLMEHITQKLVQVFSEELMERDSEASKKIDIFNKIAIYKAQAKDYIRKIQVHFFVKPIADILLLKKAGNIQSLRDYLLSQVLYQHEDISQYRKGYQSGNIINLLVYLGTDLSNCNFSSLSIWQADFRGVSLINVNFSGSDLDKSVFAESFTSILAIALSPDGRLLATGDTDGNVNVWEVSTGRLSFLLEGHTDWVRSIAFSADGTTLATSGNDKTVRLWDLQTRHCIHILRGHQHCVWKVSFCLDGSRVISGSDDRTAKVWNVFSGQCVHTLAHAGYVRFVEYMADGESAITASLPDQTVTQWNCTTGASLLSWKETSHQARAISCSADGRILATGADQDYALRIMDTATGEMLNYFQNHTRRIWSVAFSPDFKACLLATGSSDKTIRLWNAETGLVKVLQEGSGRVRSLSFSHDGKVLASSSDDEQIVKLWDVSTPSNATCLRSIRGRTCRFWSVDFNSSNSTVASGCDDGQIYIWNVKTGLLMKRLRSHQGRVRSVSVHPNGSQLLSSGSDQTMKIWDVQTGRCLKTIEEYTDLVWYVSYLHQGTQILSASDDGSIKIHDATTWELVHELSISRNWVWSIATNPMTSIMAIAHENYTIRLFNFDTNQYGQDLLGHTNQVRSVAFSPDGEILASGSDDHTVKIWDMNSEICSLTLTGHSLQVRAVNFSPCGYLLASCGDDQSIRLWEVSSGCCLNILKGHQATVWAIAFSADGCYLASAGLDSTIIIWDIQTRQIIHRLTPQRIYEGLNISMSKGLTEAQISSLRSLGAFESLL
jgi:WD40 repeat protein